jgi:hypothetical protein
MCDMLVLLLAAAVYGWAFTLRRLITVHKQLITAPIPTPAGVYTGQLRFQGPNGQLVWYTLEARVAPAPEVAAVEVACPVGQAMAIVLAVTNPLDDPLTLAASYSDPALVGPAKFTLPPGQPTELEFYYAPLSLPPSRSQDSASSAAQAGFVTVMSEQVGELTWKVLMTALPPPEGWQPAAAEPPPVSPQGRGSSGVLQTLSKSNSKKQHEAAAAGGAARPAASQPQAAALSSVPGAARLGSSNVQQGPAAAAATAPTAAPSPPAPAAAGTIEEGSSEDAFLERPETAHSSSNLSHSNSRLSVSSGRGQGQGQQQPQQPQLQASSSAGSADSAGLKGGVSLPALPSASPSSSELQEGCITLEAAVGSTTRLPVFLYSSTGGPQPFSASFTTDTPLCFDLHVGNHAALPAQPAGLPTEGRSLTEGAGKPAFHVSFVGKELWGKVIKGRLQVEAGGVVRCIELLGKNPKYVKPEPKGMSAELAACIRGGKGQDRKSTGSLGNSGSPRRPSVEGHGLRG